MFARSIFVTSLLSLCIVAPLAAAGCAAPSSDEDAEGAEVSQDELTGTAKQLAGTYWTHTPASGGFAKLKLEPNGRFTADVDPAGAIVCVQSPCVQPESGRWNATKTAGGYRLRITPTGEGSRYYQASKTATDLVLARAGQSQTLHALGANACLDTSDCDANEECGPKFCLMYCEVNDPYCCGPSTCRPTTPPVKHCGGIANLPCGPGEECVDDPNDGCDPTKGGADCGGVCQKKTPPPPPPSCWGAWLDENGLCRTPADGVYPDACCAGQSNPCGDAQCGAGTTCCNPLAGICTKPGWACAQ
jgi:hypothetical protein